MQWFLPVHSSSPSFHSRGRIRLVQPSILSAGSDSAAATSEASLSLRRRSLYSRCRSSATKGDRRRRSPFPSARSSYELAWTCCVDRWRDRRHSRVWLIARPGPGPVQRSRLAEWPGGARPFLAHGTRLRQLSLGFLAWPWAPGPVCYHPVGPALEGSATPASQKKKILRPCLDVKSFWILVRLFVVNII